mgnify:CR=1 FL=1
MGEHKETGLIYGDAYVFAWQGRELTGVLVSVRGAECRCTMRTRARNYIVAPQDVLRSVRDRPPAA